MSALIQVEMTLEEASETDRLIKRHINTTRYLLLDMRDRKGWKALGYESFKDYGEKALGYKEAYIYRLVDAAEIALQLGYDSTIVESQPKESHLQPLKSVPEDERKAIWEEATRKAEEEGEKLTAKRVDEAVEEWKRRSEDFRVESNERRLKNRDLETQLDLLKEQVAEKPQVVFPEDYEDLKAAKNALLDKISALKKDQADLVQQQVAKKLRERESELAEFERKVKESEDLLAGLQQQIDRYTLQQRELKIHLDTIEKTRVCLAVLAANMEGFESVIDSDHELRLWRALADMLRNGAKAIDFFVGDSA